MRRARRGWRPLAAVALALFAGCGLRTLIVTFHTPTDCPTSDAGCPLGEARSIRTRMIRRDGTELASQCSGVTGRVCHYEELTDFVFLNRTEASDGIEVILEARTAPGCGGEIVTRCDSFGDSVIDLTDTDEVPVWCDCPRDVTGPGGS